MLRQRDGENEGGSGRGLMSSNSRVFVWGYQIRQKET